MEMSTPRSLLAVGGAGMIGAFAIYVSPWLWRYQRVALLKRHLASHRLLALTYDDGPSLTATPQLLELLKFHEARATFFMLGKNARAHPDIVNRVVREGHDVGCHSYGHLNAWKVSPCAAINDINRGYQHLAPWIKPNAVFRPPYGKVTLPTRYAVLRRGAPIWWWTIDSGDSHALLPTPEQVVRELREHRGGIVLMHDGGMTARPSERNVYTLAVTSALLNLAKEEGLRIITLRELSNESNGSH